MRLVLIVSVKTDILVGFEALGVVKLAAATDDALFYHRLIFVRR